MDRRSFILAATAATMPAFATEPTGSWKLGVHFIKLPSAQPIVAQASAADVVEAFSYTCIHCYRFEPFVRAWLIKKPPALKFTRLPSQWDDKHRAHARLYRTLQALNRNDLDEAVFEGIHLQKNPLFSQSPAETLSMQADFAAAHGIDGKDFRTAYESLTVTAALQRDVEALTRFQITETPALVINSKYMTDASHLKAPPDPSETATFQKMFDLTDYLLPLGS